MSYKFWNGCSAFRPQPHLIYNVHVAITKLSIRSYSITFLKYAMRWSLINFLYVYETSYHIVINNIHKRMFMFINY